MNPRQAAKVDINHGQIRDELRQCGFVVFDTHALGNGYPDLHVSTAGWAIRVEVKPPGKEKSLTTYELAFQEIWQGPYIIATRTEDVIERYDDWIDKVYRPECPPA